MCLGSPNLGLVTTATTHLTALGNDEKIYFDFLQNSLYLGLTAMPEPV